MLGSVAEAEDIVQDAYLRWHGTDRAAVSDAQAFLSKTVTRLCLDQLKSARVKRETYIGPWVPEPMIEPNETDEADDITLTLMMALERLSPLERAAFLLHDVFGQDFDEVAQTIDRDAAACRQLASRAREHVRAAKPRFPVSHAAGRRHRQGLLRRLAQRRSRARCRRCWRRTSFSIPTAAASASPRSTRSTATSTSRASSPASRRKAGEHWRSMLARKTTVDGLPGIVVIENGEVMHTMAFEIDDGRITAIYVVRNPDKLRHVSARAGDALGHKAH